MTPEVLFFFNQNPEAIPLYAALEEKILSEMDDVSIKVSKTQISFSNRRNFAFVSFLPARKAKDRPETYITVTFGLGYRVDSPRIDGAVEPYPNRWTHHVLLSVPEDVTTDLRGWLEQAYAFAQSKGRRRGS